MQTADLIPRDGFFPEYFSYVVRLTDAPEVYHVASALTILSACISDRVEGRTVSQAADGEVLPSIFASSLWTLIVGPSGDRKSTAMNFAVDVATDRVRSRTSSISGSPEATFDLLTKRPNTFFYHSEGSTLFSQLQASYWLQGQGFLCDLYEGREEYKRILTGKRTKNEPDPDPREIIIRRPRVTLLVGIAPELLDATRRTDWTGGLIGRMLMLYSERTKHCEMPPRVDEAGKKHMTQWLVDIEAGIAKSGGRLRLTVQPDAQEAYAVWSRKLNDETAIRPPKLRPLFRRLPEHILRVAVLYAVSRFYGMITLDSMLPALRLGDYARRSIERVGDLLAEDAVMRNAIRISDMLQHANGKAVPISAISDALRLSWGAVEPAIKTLQMSGRAKLFMNPANPEEKFVKRIA